MGLLSRRNFILASALLAVTSALIAFSIPASADYHRDAGPAVNALIRGRWNDFFQNQPAMGVFSILFRAPFAIVADAIDITNRHLKYQTGVLACVFAAGMVGLVVARRMAQLGRSTQAQAVVAMLFVVSPLTFSAVGYGHPEELFGGALCVLAVFLAVRDRPLWAAVVLGLALSTKQWAILAVIPVLIALPRKRVTALLVAGAIAAVFWVPLAIGDREAFGVRTNQTLTVAPRLYQVTAPNVWAPFSRVEYIELAKYDDNVFAGGKVKTHTLPRAAGLINRPLIVLLPIPLALLYLLRRRNTGGAGFGAQDAFGLMALFLLARCMLDPLDIGYYHIPFLMSLLAYQGLKDRTLPWLSIVVVGACALTDYVARNESFDMLTLVYLAWTLPVSAWLALRLYAPQRFEEIVGNARSRLSPAPFADVARD